MDRPFTELFRDTKVELMRIGHVAEWRRSNEIGRLTLPPIQRSFVWRNEQIINYWDSLMRGYPAGMMMVKRGGNFGRNLDNETKEIGSGDFQLIDGQQRLTTILLGLGVGSLASSLRLWVDIGSPKDCGKERLFDLRINSSGQPYGYKSDAPNEKVRAEDRRDVHKDWLKKDGKLKPPQEIFKEFSDDKVGRLISAKCALPLSAILERLTIVGKEEVEREILIVAENNASDVKADIGDLLTRLEAAFNSEIIVKLVDGSVLDESNYPRFFGRLGQGGTRLSDEELIYSLIKDRYPHVHDRLSDIVQKVGRFASEVDLVLGALRVAQILAPRPEAKEWERAGRPTPDRVRSLNEKGADTTEPYFRSILPEDENAPCRLRAAIEHLRDGLLYSPESNPCGLPSMLLARLPRDLLDVLLLFTFKRGETSWNGEDRSTLIAFILYWLLFVAFDDKAAYRTFLEIEAADWHFGQRSIASLLRHLEAEGVARYAPRVDDWPTLVEEVEHRGCRLAKWDGRFKSKDERGRSSPGEALRVLSTHNELQKRALIWLQRHYVAGTFPNYDPTSTRDDDLPFDLDHVIPQSLFDYDWRKAPKKVELSSSDMDQFKDLRRVVGDSLGNLRWLSAADNRSRSNGKVEDEQSKGGDQLPFDDYIDRPSWNKLITAGMWASDDVATFQRLIDGRTLLLVKTMMNESGIADIINIADHIGASTTSQLSV